MTLPRFSLRLLLVAVAVLCAWLAWERSVVMERRMLRAKLESEGSVSIAAFPPDTGPASVRWCRRIFGDEAIEAIYFDGFDTSEAKGAAYIFPEAAVFVAGRADPLPPYSPAQ